MIKRLTQIVLIILILFSALAFVTVKALAFYGVCEWRPTFDDDFNGVSLDTSKWSTQYPSGNGGEQQYYAPDAFTLQDGILKITAEKRTMQNYPYTSGIITTRGTFSQQYGFFALRAKLPKGQGFWPAFWMLPVQPNYPTEIDVFEMLGNAPNIIYMTNHWMGSDKEPQKNQIAYLGADFSAGFHTFAVRWSASELIWSVDGVEQYRTSVGIPNSPMFLLANFAVGGTWPGNPDSSTPFPSQMQIDYVHVYQYQCHLGPIAVTNQLESLIYDHSFGSTPPGQYRYK
jgi:beta-glucanase (GH16 family)